jgi:hypothetical protein
MSKDKISEYAFTPAANTDIGGINIDEGCAPSGINNAIRTLMTQIRDLQAGVSGDTIPLTAGGTGSGTAASARAALGLAIGTNVLGYVTPGTSGNVLQSDGTNWTSVAQSAAVTLDTITGGPLAVAKGGTNATTAAQARTNLNALEYVTAGATGQVLTSTGTGWISQAAAGGGFTNMTVFASPGTFTTPASTTQIKVTVVGGGGAGAGNNNGGTGGTSSFGSLASATGGTGGAPLATTIGGVGSAGTLLVRGQSGLLGGASGGSSMLGGGGLSPNTPVSGSPGGQYGGGGGGGGGARSGAGAGGAIYVGPVTASTPYAVTVGAGGTRGPGPIGGGDGASGVVIVEY